MDFLGSARHRDRREPRWALQSSLKSEERGPWRQLWREAQDELLLLPWWQASWGPLEFRRKKIKSSILRKGTAYSRAVVANLTDLTDPQWSTNHWLVTAALEQAYQTHGLQVAHNEYLCNSANM